jgi:GH24 family phage-related lysozyme (muramidase)
MLPAMFDEQPAISYLRRHEGAISHMYLDSAGLVTIGVGFLLANPAAAEALNLVRRGTDVAATADEKRREWESVSAQPKALPAYRYVPFTTLDLPAGEIQRQLVSRIQTFAGVLRRRFPLFDAFPAGPQLGLIDMIYCLGPKGLFKGYPKFCAAVEAQDWKTCAAEGLRRGVSAERNADLQKLFLSATPSS